MSKYNITIPDIAKASGVSKSTVSLALQDSPKIKPETKAKVLKTAKELGYVYNRAAANLRRRSSEIIGMVINDLTNPFFAELSVTLERYFSDAGYVVMMTNTSEDLKQQDKVLKTFSEHGAAGILICPANGTPQSALASLIARGLPIVTVMRPIEGGECDYIAPDNVAGASAVTKHLLDQGMTKLAFLGGRPGTPVYQRRFGGFMAAIEESGIDKSDVEALPCAPTRVAASQTTEERVKSGSIPQGIVCYSDMVAFGASYGLHLANLKVGEDIALTGFDDVISCTTATPPLTSVHIYTDQLAKLAAESLIQRIKNPALPISNQSVMPKVIARESSQLPLVT